MKFLSVFAKQFIRKIRHLALCLCRLCRMCNTKSKHHLAFPERDGHFQRTLQLGAGGFVACLNSANLRALNVALIDFCAQNGYEFINIADALADADGNLKAAYCSDGYVHQTDLAYEVRTSLLKGYAAAQLSSAANP